MKKWKKINWFQYQFKTYLVSLVIFEAKQQNYPVSKQVKTHEFFFLTENSDRWDKSWKYSVSFCSDQSPCPTYTLALSSRFQPSFSTSFNIINWWCCNAPPCFDWYFHRPSVHCTGSLICMCIVTFFFPTFFHPSQLWIDLNFHVPRLYAFCDRWKFWCLQFEKQFGLVGYLALKCH